MRKVLEYLKKNDKDQPQYDFIMVDEGQDMNNVAYEIFKVISKHITVCLDSKQQLYEVGSTEQEILKELGVHACNVNLLEGYRCSPYIVKLAAQLIKGKKERDAYIRQTRTRSTDIETPVLFYAKSAKEEKERLISIIHTRLLNNERIAVLFPKKKQVFGYAVALRAAGLEVEDMDGLDFSKENPKLMTYHSAKGLTFDTVIMPRLVKSSFFKVAEDVLERQVFVALTRATKWVYMSTVQGQEITCLQRFADQVEQGNVTVQKSEEMTESRRSAANAGSIKNDNRECEGDNSDLLDIF
jgi:superfamily I DNA/RNA helicase